MVNEGLNARLARLRNEAASNQAREEYEKKKAEYDQQKAEYDKQQAEYQQQVAEYNRQKSAYEVAKKMFLRGQIPPRQTPEYVYYKRFMREGMGASFGMEAPVTKDYADYRKMLDDIENFQKNKPTFDSGGYYIDPKTGYGYSSNVDLAKLKGYEQQLSAEQIRQGWRLKFEEERPRVQTSLPLNATSVDREFSIPKQEMTKYINDQRVLDYIDKENKLRKTKNIGVESYSSQLDAYTSPSQTGWKGTANIRQVTPEERAKLEYLSPTMQKVFGETKSSNILTIDINRLKEKIDRGESIGVGSFVQEQQPASNFVYLTEEEFNPPKIYTGVFGKSLGVTLGEMGKDFGKAISSKTPEKKVNVSLPYQLRGTAYYSKDKGYYAPSSEITQKATDDTKANVALFGGIGKATGEILPYINPLGVKVFIAEQAGNLGSETRRYNSLGIGALSYATKYPIEAFALATGGIAKFAVSPAMKYVKAGRFNKYLTTPEEEMRVLTKGEVLNEYVEQNIRPKITKNVFEEANVYIGKADKGSTKVSQVYTKDELAGKSIEKRWLGTVRFDKSGVSKKMESFVGDVSYKEGSFKQVVDYGKYKKVVEIDKEGKGVIKLIKRDGDIAFSAKVQAKPNEFGLKETTYPSSIKIDTQTSNPLTIIDVNGRKLVKAQTGERVLTMERPDLTATNVVFESQPTIRAGSNLEKGYVQLESENKFFSDIIEVTPRKAKIAARSGKVKLVAQTQTGQKIEFGINKDVDKVLGMKGKISEMNIRSISPSMNRKIAEGESYKIVQVMVNPKSKLLRDAKIIEEIKEKQAQLLGLEIQSSLKSKAIPIIKKIEVAKSKQLFNDKTLGDTQPSYVGGEGGQASKSLYQFNPDKDVASIGEIYYVEPTESYLSRKGISQTANIPIQYDIVKEPLKSVKTILPKGEPLSKVASEPIISTASESTGLVSTTSTQSISPKPVLDTKMSSASDSIQKQPESFRDNAEFRMNQEIKLSQPSKEELSFRMVQPTKQSFQQKMTQTTTQRSITKTPTVGFPTPVLKIPPTIFKKPKERLAQRILNRIKEEPNIFEAIVTKKGEEVSLGKFRGKEEAESTLLKSLKSTLSASGRVKKDGRALDIGELNLFKTREFRPGKKDTTLIVQNKQFRLGTKGETKEVQYFRKQTKKSKGFLGL